MTHQQERRREAFERVRQIAACNCLGMYIDPNGDAQFDFIVIDEAAPATGMINLAEKLAELYEFMSTYL